MQIVWDRGEVTVRDVYEAFRARRPIAYTTVLTTMRILEQKEHLRVSRAARAHVYQARSTRQSVLQAMVRHFVDRVFGGAAEPLVQHLILDKRLSADDLRDIASRLNGPETDDDR